MFRPNLIPLTDSERVLVDEALSQYRIPEGERKIMRNTVGFINKTYIIEIGDKKLVLRQSLLWATTPEHLELEVEILRFLETTRYALSPRVIPNMRGEYLTNFGGNFYMLQNFVPGEIRASWNDVEHFQGEMLENFFRASAEFTKAAAGFRASKKYSNFPLQYYTKNAKSLFDTVLQSLQDSKGKSFLAEQKTDLLRFAEVTQKEFEVTEWDALPQQLVHFDIHPGNVHYKGDKVVGIFDFDWARFDSRIADIATTTGQSCYVYGGEQTGLYNKEKITDGLQAYRETYGPSEFDRNTENLLIKVGLKGFMFFQMLWASGWYRENFEHKDALFILQHFRNVCLENDYDSLFS